MYNKKKRTGQNNPAYYDMQLGYATANPMFPPSESDGSSLYETVPGSINYQTN